jgi:hypothetical protein
MSKTKQNRSARAFLRATSAACAAAVTFAVPAPVEAGTLESRWVAPVSGDWTDPSRWNTNPFYPDNGNPAEFEYNAVIDVPGPDYTVTLNGNIDLNSVVVRSADAVLHQTGGVFNTFSLGVGDSGAGHYRMSDGTLNVSNLAVGGSNWPTIGEGLFEVVRGQVNNADTETYVGVGTGTLVVNGPFARYETVPSSATSGSGWHFIGWGSLGTGVARFQNRASVTLGGAQIGANESVGSMLVESGAKVFVSRLDVARSSASSIAGAGTVILSGGTSQLTVGPNGLSVGSGGNGNLIVNGGTLTVQPPGPAAFSSVGSTGTVTVNGGAVNFQPRLRLSGGQLVINGGTFNASTINTGLASVNATTGATITLNGGTLMVTELTVYSSRYLQTGGTAAPVFMEVRTNEGSQVHPEVRLAGGTFDSNGFVWIRDGTFTYEGGAFSAAHLDVSGGRFVATPGRDKTLRVGTLSVSGQGRLDLGDNRMVLDSGSPPPLVNVRAMLRSGYNNGAWDGPGVMSSVAQTNATHGIGYVQPSPLFTALLVAYTRYGDADVDGAVDLDDFNALASNFGSTDAFWFEGDFNYDGRVNLADFNRFASNFGQVASGPDVTPEDWSELASAVPEPCGLACSALAGTLMLLRHRRSRC